ncbi:MAG: hypothetical protein ACI906_002110 [Candidatus Latescibacterota bacterium]|jgi:hypothetical protein
MTMKLESLVMRRRSGLLGIIAALALSLIQVNTSSAELIGRWHADGNAEDTSGQGNHGTMVNDVTYATDKNRRAFSFDGSGDKILLTSNPLSDLAQFTYVAWIKPIEEGRHELFSRSGGGFASDEFFAFLIINNGALSWVLNDAPNLKGLTETQRGLVLWGQWQHVALTRDGSTIKAYINGEEVSSHTDLRAANPVMEDPLQFADWTVPGYSFNGLIDEIGLFDTALSQSDIQLIMTNGLAGGATALEAISWGQVKEDER